MKSFIVIKGPQSVNKHMFSKYPPYLHHSIGYMNGQEKQKVKPAEKKN